MIRWLTSRTSGHRLGPITESTAGKLKAHICFNSLSTLTSPVGEVFILQYCPKILSFTERAGNVAINNPDCWRILCLTSLEGSWVSRMKISTSTPSLMSSLTFFEISAKLSAQARRTRYISSLLRRTKAGINLSNSSCSPPTLQILCRFKAVDLRTRKTGSSAKDTTSGMTNCLHRS